MVAPLFDGESKRRVILPRGAWCDFWTGEAVAGGKTITVPATYERIPVYVKSGSVFPMGGIANSTAEAETRHLTVKVVGDGSLPFSIGAGANRELLLTWEGGKGSMKQRNVERPYSVIAWRKATDV